MYTLLYTISIESLYTLYTLSLHYVLSIHCRHGLVNQKVVDTVVYSPQKALISHHFHTVSTVKSGQKYQEMLEIFEFLAENPSRIVARVRQNG